MLPSGAGLPLLLFVALIFALSLHALVAAGHFPYEHRTSALRSVSGRLVLHGSLGLALICLATGLVVAWQAIPWYAAIIGAGIAILFAPLTLQMFPDFFVDGCGALITFALGGTLSALVLVCIHFSTLT